MPCQALSLVLVDLNQDGVTRSAVSTIDPTRGHAEINFDNAAAELIGDEGDGWAMLGGWLNQRGKGDAEQM